MVSRADLSDDDWKILLDAPWVAGVLVISATGRFNGVRGEINAMVRTAKNSGVGNELIESLIEAMSDGSDDDDEEPTSVEEDLAALRSAARIVDATCEHDEATGFKQWIVAIARATAEARKVGGFLGIGGVRVSDQERLMLLQIESAIGL